MGHSARDRAAADRVNATPPLALTCPAGHTAGMRKYPADYRLLALAASVINVGIWIAVVVGSPNLPNKFMSELGKGTERAVIAILELIVIGLAYLGIAAIVGWVIQAVAVVCGFRSRRRSDHTEMSDYDDLPKP